MALASALSAAARSNGVAVILKSKPSKICVLGAANFMTATGGEPLPRHGPKPFPYETKKFSPIHALYDSPTKRFNQNSKIIVIEGNIGTGKNEFAKRLAKEFSLHHLGPVSQDHFYKIPRYDYDLREMDRYLPEDAAYYDLKKYYTETDPSHGRAAMLQQDYFRLRWFQYSEAMLHLFSTGQGVVLPRSCYSDFVFCDTMHEMGFIKKPAYNYITKVRSNAICDLWKPHLTIYIDAPVDKLMENINKRATPEEVNSPVLTEKYLQTLEKHYKQKFLPEMRKSGEVLVYDYTEMDDLEAIVDDVERLVLDSVPEDEVKFSDWARRFEDDYNNFRMSHQRKDRMLATYLQRELPFDSPEMLLSGEAHGKWHHLDETHPFRQYAIGWNPLMGDDYMKMIFSLFSSEKDIGKDDRPAYIFRTYSIHK